MKKTILFFAPLLAALALCCAPLSAAAAGAVVDGLCVDFGGRTLTEDNGAVMFPVGSMAEAMGLKFSWYPDRGVGILSNGQENVELTVGSRIIALTGSTFIADRDFILADGGLAVSGAAMARLADYFGFEAEMDGQTMTINTGTAFYVLINGSRLRFANAGPLEVYDTYYVPIDEVAEGLGLLYESSDDGRYAVIVDGESGQSAIVSLAADFVTLGSRDLEGDYRIVYENDRLYLDSDMILRIAEYFGAHGSYSRYGNGLLLSSNLPCDLMVNGVLAVFPDALPGEDGLPLVCAAEAAGLNWELTETDAVISDGAGKSAAFAADSNIMTTYDGGHQSGAVALDLPPLVRDGRLIVTAKSFQAAAEYFGLECSFDGGLINITVLGAEPFVPSKPLPDVTVQMDGRKINFPDVQPVVVDGRTLIPVRAVAEEMGMDVDWDGISRVTIQNGGDVLYMEIGSAELSGVRDGEAVALKLDVPAVTIDDRTCVPIRAVMEFFGAKVGWDEDTQTVTLTSPPEKYEIISRPSQGKDEFAALLGFTVDAPLGAADVEYSVANENTAVVKYRVGNTVFILSASCEAKNGVSPVTDFTGARLNRRLTVNGVPVTAVTGRGGDGNVFARWNVGAYEFSLNADASSEPLDFLNEIQQAANTFVITREVEPEPEELPGFSDDMQARQEYASIAFDPLGLIMRAPDGARNVEYRIWDDFIAEVSFSMDGGVYVLRGAVGAGDLFGFDSENEKTVSSRVINNGRSNTPLITGITADGTYICRWEWDEASFALLSRVRNDDEQNFINIAAGCAEISRMMDETDNQPRTSDEPVPAH